MKAKLAVFILLIVAIGLGVGWFVHSKRIQAENGDLLSQMGSLSNALNTANSSASVASQQTADLGHRLEAMTLQLKNVSNDLAVAQISLTDARGAAAAAARMAEAELNKREARIAELQVTNKGLDRQVADASGMISDLELRITETERKLSAASGDRDFLMRELDRLQTEKSDIERRFNDLVVLREQVRKLQIELAADSQLDAIRAGLSRSRRLKGAELLRRGFSSNRADDSGTDIDLDVEVRRDGSATIEGE